MTTTKIDAMLSQLVGQTIPGGCDECDAEQTVRPMPDCPGVWRMTVAHDNSCPDLRRRRESELKALHTAWKRTGNPARRAEIVARAAEIRLEMER